MMQRKNRRQAKPKWLRVPLPKPSEIKPVTETLKELELNTVCEEALCPNLSNCYSHGTATFLIMGDVCTRNCGFCNIPASRPQALDLSEPERVAEAVERLRLVHVVITSVTRDDLADGGASHYANTIRKIRNRRPEVTIEVLIPDFKGSEEALITVLDAKPDVLNHNIETVPRLYKRVRPQAKHERSLELLKKAKELRPEIATKSGLMVGLGETEEEVIQVLHDLRKVNCELVTIGQYLQPSGTHLEVVEYVLPEQFEKYRLVGERLGFISTASDPLVRSSFNAAEFYQLGRSRTRGN